MTRPAVQPPKPSTLALRVAMATPISRRQARLAPLRAVDVVCLLLLFKPDSPKVRRNLPRLAVTNGIRCADARTAYKQCRSSCLVLSHTGSKRRESIGDRISARPLRL